jgi:hypothetical protein
VELTTVVVRLVVTVPPFTVVVVSVPTNTVFGGTVVVE